MCVADFNSPSATEWRIEQTIHIKSWPRDQCQKIKTFSLIPE